MIPKTKYTFYLIGADPWYTGDFDKTYNDVLEGCTALLKEIKKEL